MKNYTVDYGNAKASIWIPDDADPLRMFSLMAHQMFGIRNSIMKTPAAFPDSKEPPGMSVALAPYAMALSHHGDLATFDADGNKILSEFGDLYGFDAQQVIGAAKITGRTDLSAIATELAAKEPSDAQ